MRHKKELKGIGGWLLLVTILLIIAGVSTIYLVLIKILTGELFLFFNYPQVIISFIFLIVLSFFIWYSIYLIFKKRIKAIKWSILTLWLIFLYNLWHYLIAVLIFQFNDFLNIEGVEIIRRVIMVFISLIVTIIWVLYFKKSIRVKNTFIK